jgi:hypothetical protein
MRFSRFYFLFMANFPQKTSIKSIIGVLGIMRFPTLARFLFLNYGKYPPKNIHNINYRFTSVEYLEIGENYT